MPLRCTTELPGHDLAIEDVDLDLAELDRGDDRPIVAGAHDG